MQTTKKQVSEQRQRREVRRLIGRALTGVALSAGLMTVPAMAATVTSNADSGTGSLRAALDTPDGTVDFTPLGTDTIDLLSTLPSITDDTTFTLDINNPQVVTINNAVVEVTDGKTLSGGSTGSIDNDLRGAAFNDPNTLTLTGGTSITNSTNVQGIMLDNLHIVLNGDGGGTGGNGGNGGSGTDGTDGANAQGSTAGASGTAGVIGAQGATGATGTAGSDANITSNLTLDGFSEVDLNGGVGGNGGDGGQGGQGGAGGNGGAGSPGGSNGTAGGNGGAGGIGGQGGDGGNGGDGSSASITGNVTLNDSSVVKLTAGTGGNGGDGGDGGSGTGGTGGFGLGYSNAPKGFGGTGGAGGDGGTGGTGGIGGIGGDTFIDGNVVAHENTQVILIGGAGGEITTVNDGIEGAGGHGGDGGNGTTAGLGGAGGTGNPDGDPGAAGPVGGSNGTGGAGGTGGDGGLGGAGGKIAGGGGDSYITKNVTTDGNSAVFLLAGDGGGATISASTGGAGGNTYIVGSVESTGLSTYELSAGDGGAGGNSGVGGKGGDSHIDGGVTATYDNSGAGDTFAISAGNGGDGANAGVGGSAFISNGATANGYANFNLTAGNGGDGAGAGNGGVVSITGAVIANAGSTFTLTSGNDGDTDSSGGDVYIDGSATANGTDATTHSTITLNGTNGSSGNTYITGDATATHFGEFHLHNGSHIGTDDDPSITVLAENSGKIYLDGGSHTGTASKLANTSATSNGEYHLDDSTIHGTAEAGGGGIYELKNDSNITGNAIANDGGLFTLTTNSSIGTSDTSVDTTATGTGEFDLDASTIYGTATTVASDGTYSLTNSSVITGNATANDGGLFTLTTNSSIGTSDTSVDTTAAGTGKFDLDESTIYGTAETLANGGIYELSNGSVITGNATANNGGLFTLTIGSSIGVDGTPVVTTAAGTGKFNLDDSTIYGSAETLAGGGAYSLTNGSNISGNATANAGGTIDLINSSIGTALNHVTATANGGAFTLDPSIIYGDAITINNGTFALTDHSSITNDATTTGTGGMFTLTDGSSITGNATTAGTGGIFDLTDSSIGGTATIAGTGGRFNLDNSHIDSGAIANNDGYFNLSNNSYITGNANFNNTSNLEVKDLNTIDGNLTFGSNSTFLPHLDTLDAANPSVVNTLTVTGTLTPGGATIKPTLDNFITLGQITPLQDYTVINSATRTGTFNSIVNSILPFVIEYDVYNPGDVILRFSPDVTSPQGGFDITNLPGTLNERTLGAYLNNLVIYDPNTQDYTIEQSGTHLPWYDETADFGDILTAISNDGDLTQFQDSELTGDSYTSYYAQAYWNQKAFIDSIADQLRNGNNTQESAASFALNPSSAASISGRLNSLRQIMDTPTHGLGYANGGGSSNSNGIWANVSGRSLSTDRDDYIGSPNWHSSSVAYNVGYTGGSDSFNWGVAAGHQKSDLTFYDRNASGESEGYNAGLYAGWNGKKGYLNAILGYGNYDNDAVTHGGSGSSSFKTHGLSAALEIGKHLSGDKDSGFTPYGSLMWVRSKVGNIHESYEGGSGIAFQSGSQNTLTSQLGIRYNNSTNDRNGQKKGGWQAGLSWLHNFGENDFAMEGSYPILGLPFTFTERNTPLFSNALQVELGAYGRIHNSLLGFVGYRGVFSSEQKQNSVTAGIGYQF